MHSSLQFLAHRPWPLPQRPWTWRQNWYELLFAHWPISSAQLRPLIPSSLTIQEFNGTSWIGIVPFRMTGVMRRPMPDLPWVSAFPELNVRIYVERDGKPGVWFLSLDATNPLAVWAAKRFFYLPYWHSKITFSKEQGKIQFRCRRSSSVGPVSFEAEYGPIGEPFAAAAGSLEQFLAERYCLYCQSSDGRLYRCEVHHKPWPLQKAQGRVFADEFFKACGFAPPQEKPVLHYSAGVETIVWPLEAME